MKATVYDMADAIRDVLGLAPLYDKSVDYKKTDAQRFHQDEEPMHLPGWNKHQVEDNISRGHYYDHPDFRMQQSKQGWFGQIHARRGNRV